MKSVIEKPPFIYWDDITKINCLQRFIIIHSILYYVLDSPTIPDYHFDYISNVLYGLQNKVPKKTFKSSQYYYCMHDFDGNTGFDLYSRLNKNDKSYLENLAKQILILSKGE